MNSIPPLSITSDSDLPNPKLFILNSYDKLINLVDIHTEEILAKHAESDLFADVVSNVKIRDRPDNGCNIQTMFEQNTSADLYKEEYEIDEKLKKPRTVDLKTTTVHEYVNKMRQEMIDELKKQQGDTLEMFDQSKRNTTNGDETKKSVASNIDQEKLDVEKDGLFGNKYCFIIETKTYKVKDYSWQCTRSPLEMRLFVLDFFLDAKTQVYLK